jgi:hypothetical protein
LENLRETINIKNTETKSSVGNKWEHLGLLEVKSCQVPSSLKEQKNEALQVLCSVLLTDDVVRINNIPDILDVQKLIIILKELGVKVKRLNKKMTKA